MPPEPIAPLSAVAILDREPGLTPAELAARAGVTLSYARSLVRRRNAKRTPAIVRPVEADASVAVLQTQVRELVRRVEQAETRGVRATVPLTGVCRSQVIERSAAGVPVNAISEELGIPVGEAEFILKMDRLRKSLNN
jgi:DNA-directed RNA polymerase specialized sigma24 family protein